MAIGKGSTGSLKLGANTWADVTSWSFNHTLKLADVTALGDKDDVSVQVGRSSTGTLSGSYDATDAAAVAAVAQMISSATPATSTLILIENTTTGSISGYTGSAWLNGITLGATANDVQTFTVNFTYTAGVIAYTS